jgi:hypothetical protein
MHDWLAVFETNVFGAARSTSAAIRTLRQRTATPCTSSRSRRCTSPVHGSGSVRTSRRSGRSTPWCGRSNSRTPGSRSRSMWWARRSPSSEPMTPRRVLHPEWVHHGYVSAGILEPVDHGEIVAKILNLPSRVLVDHVKRPGPALVWVSHARRGPCTHVRCGAARPGRRRCGSQPRTAKRRAATASQYRRQPQDPRFCRS